MALDILSIFPLLNARATNDWLREGSLVLEYRQFSVTISTNTGDAEVPTNLDECLGLIPLNYTDTFESGDYITSMTTDGVISTSAVTVRLVTVSIADGAHVFRCFLVGRIDTGSAISITEAS